MSTTNRNDVKQLAATIEALARNVQSTLDNNGDFLAAANELVRNNITFVFTLGELYTLEKLGSGKSVSATPVSAPKKNTANYHSLRDSRGRFARKV
jgi:hypothetical protein